MSYHAANKMVSFKSFLKYRLTIQKLNVSIIFDVVEYVGSYSKTELETRNQTFLTWQCKLMLESSFSKFSGLNAFLNRKLHSKSFMWSLFSIWRRMKFIAWKMSSKREAEISNLTIEAHASDFVFKILRFECFIKSKATFKKIWKWSLFSISFSMKFLGW